MPLSIWPYFAARVSAATVAPPSTPAGFKASLRAFLEASAVGPLVNQITPVRLYQTDSYPLLRYSVTSRSSDAYLSGPNLYRAATVEFAAKDQDYAVVDAIILAIGELFHGQVNYTMGNVFVLMSYAEADDDEYEGADDASDDGTYEDSLSITFEYKVQS